MATGAGRRELFDLAVVALRPWNFSLQALKSRWNSGFRWRMGAAKNKLDAGSRSLLGARWGKTFRTPALLPN